MITSVDLAAFSKQRRRSIVPAIRRVRSYTAAWIHFLGNAVALLLALWSLWLRSGDMAAAVLPGGLILSALTVLILLVTGWLGGELAYRHKIGVIDGEAGTDARSAVGNASR